MRQTHALTHPKHKPPQALAKVKNTVRKYIKRERRKQLPEEVDFWDFDCKFGDTEQEAEVIHLSEMSKRIMAAEALGMTSFYVEILAKEGYRHKNPLPT